MLINIWKVNIYQDFLEISNYVIQSSIPSIFIDWTTLIYYDSLEFLRLQFDLYPVKFYALFIDLCNLFLFSLQRIRLHVSISNVFLFIFQYLKNQPDTVANGGKIKTDDVKVPAGSKACSVMWSVDDVTVWKVEKVK